MKSKKLVKVFSAIFIALFGIVTFIGGSGISDAREVSEADFISHIQCDESAELVEADNTVEEVLSVESVEASECETSVDSETEVKKESLAKRIRNRVSRLNQPILNGYSWNG